MTVFHRERCPPNRKLQAFVVWWDVSGPFDIVIVRGSTTDAEQAALYAQGRTAPGPIVTNAKFASDSAHGHDAAIDCQPVRELYPSGGVRLVYLGNEDDPFDRQQAILRLDQFDQLAKQHGLETGERYPGICDRPHACDPDWRTLPP